MASPQPNHTDIYRALGQIEGRMDGLEKIIAEGFADLKELLKDHDVRIKGVETFQAEQKGGWKLLTIIGAAAAAVGGIIASAWSSLFGGG